MRNLRSLLNLALVFSTIVAAVPASAQAPDDDPLIHEARQYAADYEVEVEEALRRLRLQGAIGKLESTLERKEAATFAGVWIQHTPEYRIFAQFTPAGGHDLQGHVQAEGLDELTPVIERRTVRLPLRRLKAMQTLAHRITRQNGVPADSRINVIENRVEILSTAPDRAASAIGSAGRTLRQAVDLDLANNVHILSTERLAGQESYIYAGLPLSDCTSGFAVQNAAGTRGVLTAGHCNNSPQQHNQRYLSFQAEAIGGASDVQWHTAPDFYPDNRIYDGISDTTSPLYRFVTGTKSSAQQVIGEYVCKYGMITGYTCGTISSKTFHPDVIPNATASFILVTGNGVNLSEPGDSGGPWFSGGVAYGVHSCFYNDDACYSPIDAIAPLGVSVLTSSPTLNVGRWTYRSLGNNVSHYTGINANEYECGIAGMAARNGDINEDDSGNILLSYLYKENNHWKIRGDFRTHNNMESWDFDLLCLKKSVFPVSRFEYRNLGGNVTYGTTLSTTTYECGIGGLAARNGDIDEDGSADILQAYMYRSSGRWTIRTDFHSHNNGEEWDVDALCVEKSAPVTRHEFRNLGNDVNYNTFLSTSTHECGVVGIAARDGDIEEHNTGDILQAYLYKLAGTWWFRGDFRTHNDQESWDLDVLCVQR